MTTFSTVKMSLGVSLGELADNDAGETVLSTVEVSVADRLF